MAAVQSQGPDITPLQGYVGFDTLTKQIEHRLLRRGFQFNVICVGQTGLGKSTLINTLFHSHLIDSKGRLNPDDPLRQTTEIQNVSHTIVENGVKLRLNIVDTPGFADQINNDSCWEPIVKYIKEQHAGYLRRELTAIRDKFNPDTRIHCCLYFINPTGLTLKPLDIAVMKKLSEIVNVVPIIAKADSLSLEERAIFKQRIRAVIAANHISLFPFDTDELEPEERQMNSAVREALPFAVVGSNKSIVVDGKHVRGRQHRWGFVNVDDPSHCEFSLLRRFLTTTHLQDLIESTAHTHYEQFRSKQLMALKENAEMKDKARN